MSAKVKKLKLGYTDSYVGRHIYPFDEVFSEAQNVGTEGWAGVDALILWGGEDIHPSYYGQKANKHNQCQVPYPSMRDIREAKAATEAIEAGIPIIGVCRGAQFVCALAGGTLVQHAYGHGVTHTITAKNGYDEEIELVSSSAHHQMMNPWNLPPDDYELLAWTTHRKGNHYLGENEEQIDVMRLNPEPEIVLFKNIKALGIQGHPEWMEPDSPFNAYCNHLVREFLLPVTVE